MTCYLRLHELPVAGLIELDDLRPLEGAEVLARRADGTPGAYTNRSASGSTVLMHGGANLLANAMHDTSAARVVPQLLAWVSADASRGAEVHTFAELRYRGQRRR